MINAPLIWWSVCTRVVICALVEEGIWFARLGFHPQPVNVIVLGIKHCSLERLSDHLTQRRLGMLRSGVHNIHPLRLSFLGVGWFE